MAAGDLLALNLTVVDEGLFNKVLAWCASLNGLPAEALRKQWAAEATLAIPVLLRGYPGSVELAEAFSDFIRDPKTLIVRVKGRGEGVPLSDLRRLNRADLMSQLELYATATK